MSDLASATPAALGIKGLTKRYGDGTLAVEDLDLEVPAGSFFGLLGPNGAGKTTLIGAVCNLIRITSGEVTVFGNPTTSMKARRTIGIAEQEPNLDKFLTVYETLLYHGGYYGMGQAEADERAEQMIDAFDLRDKRDVEAPKLSGGMRRRLLLARALLHRPSLVILDEPTAGVDLELRHELWSYIRKLHAQGTTILLTTHYLEEAEALCDEIALISGGRIVARDTASGLKQAHRAETLEQVYLKTVAGGRIGLAAEAERRPGSEAGAGRQTGSGAGRGPGSGAGRHTADREMDPMDLGDEPE
jgi:ABC-2 type transport system ATP-binding protein